MAVILFDLDNTLITNDSDYLWGQFLVDEKIVDAAEYELKNRQFFENYEQGILDIDEYLKFSLKPLSQHPTEQLFEWRRKFISTKIQPIIAPKTAELLAKHRNNRDTLVIISATNLFITQPIAELLGIPHILSTEPEFLNGRYTGQYIGTTTFKEGKVIALREWLEQQQLDLKGSYFYSDSHNDLPLLEQVDHPVAVNPDEKLQKVANERSWPIIDLRT